MTHFVGAVIVADAATPQSAIKTAEKMLERYHEEREVEAHRVALAPRRVAAMREHYHLQDAPLGALAPYVEEWVGKGYRGEWDPATPDTLYYWTTDNPEGYYDYYQIGRVWASLLSDTVVPVSELASLLPDAPPYTLVLPNGEWKERGRMGWFATATDELPREAWGAAVQELLAPYNVGCVAVMVQFHC